MGVARLGWIGEACFIAQIMCGIMGGSKLTGKTADIGRGPISGVFPRKGIFLWKL